MKAVSSKCSPAHFTHLQLMALDPYDLALSKLERNIERDRSDFGVVRTAAFRRSNAARFPVVGADDAPP